MIQSILLLFRTACEAPFMLRRGNDVGFAGSPGEPARESLTACFNPHKRGARMAPGSLRYFRTEAADH